MKAGATIPLICVLALLVCAIFAASPGVCNEWELINLPQAQAYVFAGRPQRL